MLKKYVVLSIALIIATIGAMEPSKALAPWVAQATCITVRTLTKHGMNVAITNTTTVADVKSALCDREGIPADQQSISASWANWKSLWLFDTHGAPLSDTTNIRQIMNKHNTDRFLLVLNLPNRVSSN